jgi:hypothetical protein
VLAQAVQLRRNIARQYAYLRGVLAHVLPAKQFTFDAYR